MNIFNIKTDDTIVAIATPAGIGAIAIIRISGKNAYSIINSIFTADKLTNRMITYGKIIDGADILDEIMCVYMKAPATYTGEDCVEVYTHGSSIIAKNIMALIIKKGARMAQPGEFTKLAFLNGKMDLSQAEAVADVINANTQAATDTALNQLSGRLKTSVTKIMEQLIKDIAHIEVTVDYPHDDIEEQTSKAALESIDDLLIYINKALKQSSRGKIYRNGIRLAIIGQPNVGKSSLLNAILGESRAIVTSNAGTTRDTLEAHVDINGVEVIINDTAGIHDSEDDMEQLGIQRAYMAYDNAQLILFVIDSSKTIDDNDMKLYNHIKNKPHLIVISKSDISAYEDNTYAMFDENVIIFTSALDNSGIDTLEDAIIDTIAGDDNLLPKETELSNLRHIDAMQRAGASLEMARSTLLNGMPVDLAVIDLRDALNALGEITGANVDEDVINSIFSGFCVGK